MQGGRPSESAGRVLRKQRGESLENNGESLKVYGEEYFGEMFAPSLLRSFTPSEITQCVINILSKSFHWMHYYLSLT